MLFTSRWYSSLECGRFPTRQLTTTVNGNDDTYTFHALDFVHHHSVQSSTPANASALSAFNQQLNSYAGVRDFLMTFTTGLVVTTANSIKMQACSLSQLTQATNQLTRSSLVTTVSIALL